MRFIRSIIDMDRAGPSVANLTGLSKLREIVNSSPARRIVRIVSFFYFGYVFYILTRYYYPQIELDLPFAIRCGIISAMASGGLFLSSFTYFKSRKIIGFTLMLPMFLSFFFVTPGFVLIWVILAVMLLYSYLAFGYKKCGLKNEISVL